MKYYDREKEASAIKLPKRAEPRVVVYEKKDVSAMLKACRCLRDRLLLEILAETGARRGELYNMQIKDVQFDQYSAIVWLRGKSGTRTRRLYASIPDLKRYLEEHPHRDVPDAKFWINHQGDPLNYQTLYKIVSDVGFHTLKRNIYPHGFRHSAATNDAKSYTDREMMIRYGWKRTDMVSVYAHLSARDVDDKDLILHGLKPANLAKDPLIETRQCPQCQEHNAPVAMYCHKCGSILTDSSNNEEVKNLQEQVMKQQKQLEQLQGQFETILKGKVAVE
jgi:integrase